MDEKERLALIAEVDAEDSKAEDHVALDVVPASDAYDGVAYSAKPSLQRAPTMMPNTEFTRNHQRDVVLRSLVEMGFSWHLAEWAAENYETVEQCVDAIERCRSAGFGGLREERWTVLHRREVREPRPTRPSSDERRPSDVVVVTWTCTSCQKSDSTGDTCQQCGANRVIDPETLLAGLDDGKFFDGDMEAKKVEQQERESKGLLSDDDDMVCSICFSEMKKKDCYVPECKHISCKECFRECLMAKIEEAKVDRLSCVEYGCTREITEEEVKLMTNDEGFQRYQRFQRDKRVAMDPKLLFCSAANCDTVLHRDQNKVGGSKKMPVVECPACQHRFCAECAHDPHGSTKCEDVMNNAFGEYRSKNNVNRCPRCKVNMEKSAGCNHMTCSRCRYEFCWLCKREYSDMHFAPFNVFGCPGLQDDGCSWLGNDYCCCINCKCYCGVGGFFKRWGVRLLALLGMVLMLVLAILTMPIWLYNMCCGDGECDWVYSCGDCVGECCCCCCD